MPIDKDTLERVEKHLSTSEGRTALGRAMSGVIRDRLGAPRHCPKCNKQLPLVMDPMLHTDEECCVYLVMES